MVVSDIAATGYVDIKQRSRDQCTGVSKVQRFNCWSDLERRWRNEGEGLEMVDEKEG